MSTSNDLGKRLDLHPELKEHVLKLLELAENMGIDRADDIEIEVSKVIPSLARQAIEDWAVHKESQCAQSLRQADEQASPDTKKNSTGTRLTE